MKRAFVHSKFQRPCIPHSLRTATRTSNLPDPDAMPRPSPYREALLELSSAQRGLATAAQLDQLGVARSTIARRSQAGGMWSRILPGVHLISGGNPDPSQRELAALLYAGECSAVTGLAALRHHGLQLPHSPGLAPALDAFEIVHVLVPHSRRRVSTSFVQIERTTRMPDPASLVVADGLCIVPITRALADAARRLRNPSAVRALVLDAVRSGLVSYEDLSHEVAAGQRRGSAHLRDVLGHARAGAWSIPESQLREVLLTSGLPEPVWNRPIATRNGQVIAIPDAWFDEVALAIEVDSRQHNSVGPDWERTLRRQPRYARLGIMCLPVTPAQIRDDPGGLTAEVVAAYRVASSRPRPDVQLLMPLSLDERRALTRPWGG